MRPVVLIGEAVVEIPLAVQALPVADHVVVAVQKIGEPVVVALAAVEKVIGAVRAHAGVIVGQRVDLVPELSHWVGQQRRGQYVVRERRAGYVSAHRHSRPRVVDDVRGGIGRHFQEGRKIAPDFRRRRHRIVGRRGRRSQAGHVVVGYEEEEAVLAVVDLGNVNRAAERETGRRDLAGLLFRPDGSAGQPGRPGVLRGGVPAELLHLPGAPPVNHVGASLGGETDEGADGMAHGSVERRRLDAHFVHRVGESYVTGASSVGSGGRVAIQQELVEAGAQTARSVIGRRGVVQGAVIVGLQAAREDHAGGHGLQDHRVHLPERQVRHILRVEHAAGGGGGAVQQRRVGVHRDGNAGVSDFQLHIESQAVPGIQRNTGLLQHFEASRFHRHGVLSGSQEIDFPVTGGIRG